MNASLSKNKKNTLPFKPLALVLAFQPLLGVYAAESDTLDTEGEVLDTIVVVAKKEAHRKEKEVTGLGKVVKTTDTLDKNQVMNIRDLTRYDPGISVVEQGRGASSGYSIRGVDKNRIGFSVDGIPQIQHFNAQANANAYNPTRHSSGAINEIEYENIRDVEINKGANSTESGSGALGGSLAFRTKNPDDIIKIGQNWGIDSKTSYSSKNKQKMQSLAFAGRSSGFEGMVIGTLRSGSEIQAHSAAGDITHTVNRLSAYEYRYTLWSPFPVPTGTDAETDAYRNDGAWFIVQDECPSLDCTPKATATNTTTSASVHTPKNRTASAAEQAQIDASLHPTEQISADDYTGPNRVKPNPMDYDSASWLLKGTYHFTPQHRVTGVFEHTAQRYDIRDMMVRSYASPSDLQNYLSNGYYQSNNFTEAVYENPYNHAYPTSLFWSKAVFYDEKHKKNRYGLAYEYQVAEDQPWLDHVKLSFDHQNILLNSFKHEHRCSPYPTIDKNCRPDTTKPWSYYKSDRTKYQEKHNLVRLDLSNKWKWGFSEHDSLFSLGADFSEATLQRSDYVIENVQSEWTQVNNATGSYSDPYIMSVQNTLYKWNLCTVNSQNVDHDACDKRKIRGRNYSISLRDNITLGKYVDLGLGGRYDYHRFKSDYRHFMTDPNSNKATYKNFSWNAGLVLKPTEHIDLAYRISSGFRVPAYTELFGYQLQIDQDHIYKEKIKPEKSLNQEIGLAFKGDFGYVEVSYFKNRYRDLIDLVSLQDSDFLGADSGIWQTENYYNAQNIDLKGINVLAYIYWDGIYKAIPTGFYSTFAYNRVKPGKISVNPRYNNFNTLLLDTIQPSRYIMSFGYDQPEGRWGVNTTFTYSKPKANDELIGAYSFGWTSGTERASEQRSKSWYTWDISGYLTLKDHYTITAGIYNLFNRKYSTWESIRQSATTAVNRQVNVTDYARYAAPGRNFVLTLQMKF